MNRNETLKSYAIITFGCFLYGLALDWFYVPNDLTCGGLTGVSQIINYFVPVLPVGVMIIVMKFMESFKDSKWVEGAMSGIRPVTVGLIAAAFIYIAETSLVRTSIFSMDFIKAFPGNIDVFSLIVFAATIVMAQKFKVSPIIIILIMGAAGAILCGQVA